MYTTIVQFNFTVRYFVGFVDPPPYVSRMIIFRKML